LSFSLKIYISNTEIPLSALIPPLDGGRDIFCTKSPADPLQGLVEALLGEDEVSQVPLYTPGHEKV